MFEIQKPDPKAPSCPLCTKEMALKKIHRQAPSDHFVFKCGSCQLEYPVVGQKHD
jgi:predicted  nucleic acid-binding Zn ribbon protein